MACFLQQYMATFLKQKKLKGCNDKNISQLKLFSKAAWTFVLAIYEAGWNQINTVDNITFQSKVKFQFIRNQSPLQSLPVNDNRATRINHVLLPLPPYPSKETREKSKKALTKHNKATTPYSFVQAAMFVENILCIKEAFLALPNSKILNIYNLAFLTIQRKRKIQIITKEPSRKQAIVPILEKYVNLIIKKASIHAGLINSLLKNTKSTIRSEFICLCLGGVSIATNNIPAPSDLSIIEKYIKSINSINNNKVLSSCLPQFKSYFKIIDIPYIQPNGNKPTYEDIVNSINYTSLFENISLVLKPRVIKALLKLDITIVWLDIWNSQNSSKAKFLINHFFNFGCHIATIRGTNMNPGIPQCCNCWKWGHSIFACRAHGSKCQKCSRPHKIEHYRDMAWCCKANLKINPPRLETKAGKPCPYLSRNKKMHQTLSSSKSPSATSYTIFLATPILKEIYYTVLLNILNSHFLFEMVV